MSNSINSIRGDSVCNGKMIRIDGRLTVNSLSLSQRLANQVIIFFAIITGSSLQIVHPTATTPTTPTTTTTTFEIPTILPKLLAAPISTTTTTAATPVLGKKCFQDLDQIQEQRQLHMDILEQPCEDFYEYACGNWRVGYQLRMLKATDTLTAIKAANQQQLIRYFETIDHEIDIDSMTNEKSQNSKSLSQNAAVTKLDKNKEMTEEDMDNAITNHIEDIKRSVVNLYRSCLDNRSGQSKQRKSESLQFYINTLKSFAGDWPILQAKFPTTTSTTTKMNNTFNWEDIIANMRRYGVQAILRVLVQANWQSSKQLVFYLLPPTFDLLKLRTSDGYFDEELLFLYQRYIKYLFLDLGVPVRKANRIASEVVDFEQELFNLSKNQSQSIILKAPQTLQNVIAHLPTLELRKYFRTLFKEFEMPEEWTTKLLIVTDIDYLVKLSALMQRSSPDLLSKYLLVQFLAHFEFNLNDEESFTKQQQDCLRLVNDFLPQELSLLFLHLKHLKSSREFLHQAQQHVNELFRKLKTQFMLMLNSSEVFVRDPHSRQLSMEKLKNMRLVVPQISALDIKPLTVQIQSDKYEHNLVNLWQLKTKRELTTYMEQLLELQPAVNTPYMPSNYGPLNVNAYYRLRQNAIELPIGILQPPLYDPCLSAAQLYGGFGYILAHELIHGFDYDGLNYDHTGSLSDGWGVKAIIKFGVRSRCYLQQRYANGLLNVNENIADTEGLRLSLETFLHSLDDAATIETNVMKEFFLSFAQTWCGSNSLTSTIPQHASHKERVNNVLSNFMEFIDVYKCKATASLHAEEKCRICQIREGIIRCILATDMARHNEILTQFKDITSIFDYSNRSHINLLCMVLIKVADISNEARPMNVGEPWFDRLLQEFFAQSAAEKSEGLPVTPFMDPDKISKAGSQVRFIGLVLLPLFEALGDLLPEVNELIIMPARVALDYYKRLNEAQNKSRKSVTDTSSVGASENTSGTSGNNVDTSSSTTTGAGVAIGTAVSSHISAASAGNSMDSISPQMPRSQSGISVKSRRSIPSQKSASRNSVDEVNAIAAELHDLPEGSESGDSETATEVDVAEKTSKFKVDTEGSSSHRTKLLQTNSSRKSSREKRPSMIGEMCSSGNGQRILNSYGNIHGYHSSRNHFSSNRAVSLDQYSSVGNDRRSSNGLQQVISDSNVFYNHSTMEYLKTPDNNKNQQLNRNANEMITVGTTTAIQSTTGGSSTQMNISQTVPNLDGYNSLRNNNYIIGDTNANTTINSTSTTSTATSTSNNMTAIESYAIPTTTASNNNQSISNKANFINGNMPPTQILLPATHHYCSPMITTTSAATAAVATTTAATTSTTTTTSNMTTNNFSNNLNGVTANSNLPDASILPKPSWKTRLKQFSDYFTATFDKNAKRYGSTRSTPCSLRNNNTTRTSSILGGSGAYIDPITGKPTGICCTISNNLQSPGMRRKRLIQQQHELLSGRHRAYSLDVPSCQRSTTAVGENSRNSSVDKDTTTSSNTLHSSTGTGSDMPTCIPPPTICLGSIDTSDTNFITTGGLQSILSPTNLSEPVEVSLSVDMGSVSASPAEPAKI